MLGLSWLSQWLSRDVVESQRLRRDVCRGNSTQNHALSRCPRLVQLFQRCLLSLRTNDVLPTLLKHVCLSGAAEEAV